MGIIICNGQSSADYGIKVWPIICIFIIIIETTRTYVVSFGRDDKKDFTAMANKLVEWLHSCSGYARLEDSYEPDFYRLAMYKDSNDITNVYHQAGQVTLRFNCKPQRFLKSGDNVIRFNGFGRLENPTNFEARPIIKVYGSGDGVLKIGEYTVTIKSIDGFIVIDSELMDAYKDGRNCNSQIELNGNFPRLTKGRNAISFSGGITSLEVQPKWWTI